MSIETKEIEFSTLFKLEEAKFFFNKMKENENKFYEFLFYLDAFITSSRSITWVLQKELKDRAGFQEWYELKQNEMNETQIFRFFKNLRDGIIHEGKRPAKRHMDISSQIRLESHEPIKVEIPPDFFAEPDIKKIKVRSVNNPDKKVQVDRLQFSISWHFQTDQNFEVISLCNKYLAYLEKLVNEAKKLFIP